MTTSLRHALPAIPAVLLLTVLSACGGGGGGGGSGGTVNPPPVTETLALSAPVFKTIGGKNITLGASTATGSAATWTLASGSVGSLSASSGASVFYQPPASVSAISTATVTAAIGSLSRSATLYVYPDPGAPALSLIAGADDLQSGPVDGQGASARFQNPRVMGAAPDGSIYVADFNPQGTLTEDRFALRKISAAGVVSTLATNVDLNPNYYNDVVRIGVDRAGTVYVAENGRTSLGNNNPSGGAIYKLGADGKLALFAGELSHNAAANETFQQDGTGSAAKFYAPDIVGFDADNNLYIKDNPRNVSVARPYRKVTPAGVVTTIDALPAGVGAADDGNTDAYSADISANVIYRTPAGGVKTVVAGVAGQPGDQLGALPGLLRAPNALIPLGPYSYAFSSGTRVLKLVTPR